MDAVNSLSNFTNQSHAGYYEWSGGATLQVLFTIATFLTNGFVLAIFASRPRLITPFSIYLINLLIANVVDTLANPLRIVELLRTDWFAWSRWCLVMLYSDWIPNAIVQQSHLLITVNRIWAIARPISYRNSHTKPVAMAICAGTWLYVHIIILPFYVRDLLYYGNFDSDRWCIVNVSAQKGYAMMLQLVIYLIPYILILLAYPFLWYRRRMQMRAMPRSKEWIPLSGTEDNSLNTTPTKNTPQEQSRKPVAKKRSRENSTGFTVLTVQTISILVCWTSSKIYGTASAYFHYELGWLGQVGNIMYMIQMVIDPLLFVLVLPELRAAVIQVIKCRNMR
ncbi:alpha-2B adrenergic receptor-like [Paramacrobiotus metropolitanus]|uniref:alpha-2B adrenergic receptor-like n=1 Tax=Paramacrobiotus metropolitanus TaxID=2943436 RepID=UPI0024456DB3|nr:alpha-2B adrenergic receptor-like [Paramacrobiotus metropolitanus]